MISSNFSLRRAGTALTAGLFAAAITSVALADPITFVRTEQNIDWTSDGISGVGGGSGTINLGGVSGPVGKAFLYWHGINNSGTGAVYDNATISVNGNSVTGTAIGEATTNCWGAGSSRAFRADITSLVSGNGAYSLTGLSDGPGHNANGAAMVVTFDDGVGTNNRDLVFFEGNDSNIAEGFPGEADGWDATLGPIDYGGGPAVAQILLSDGQDFGLGDGTLSFTTVNGNVSIADTANLYDGNSLPSAGTSRAGNGELFDIHTFNITDAFGGVPGDVQLGVNGMLNTNDCLGLIAMLLDLDPFTAPSPGINLDPQSAFNELNTSHEVTATVTDGDDNPLPGILVDFELLAGPNAGLTGSSVTGAAGQASFVYTGTVIGVDTIEGSFSDGVDTFSSTALKFWDNDCNMTSTPDTCDVSCDGFGGACGLFGNCGTSDDDNGDGVPDECSMEVERCEMDDNGQVDHFDIKLILALRNTVASGPDDPADADGDGFINANDARVCALQCTFQYCSSGPTRGR